MRRAPATPQPFRSTEGTLLAGRYEILGIAGSGEMGILAAYRSS